MSQIRLKVAKKAGFGTVDAGYAQITADCDGPPGNEIYYRKFTAGSKYTVHVAYLDAQARLGYEDVGITQSACEDKETMQFMVKA